MNGQQPSAAPQLADEMVAVRNHTRALLAQLADADLGRSFSGGRATLRGVLRALLEHEQEHLQQLLSTRRRVAARRTEIEAIEADLAAAHGAFTASLLRVPSAKVDTAWGESWSIRQVVQHLIDMEKGWQDGLAHLVASASDRDGPGSDGAGVRR